MTTKTTADTITDRQIATLAVEAGEHGDTEQIIICYRALGGDADARAECARVISAAKAMEDSE